jgi:hypothetical protein
MPRFDNYQPTDVYDSNKFINKLKQRNQNRGMSPFHAEWNATKEFAKRTGANVSVLRAGYGPALDDLWQILASCMEIQRYRPGQPLDDQAKSAIKRRIDKVDAITADYMRVGKAELRRIAPEQPAHHGWHYLCLYLVQTPMRINSTIMPDFKGAARLRVPAYNVGTGE